MFPLTFFLLLTRKIPTVWFRFTLLDLLHWIPFKLFFTVATWVGWGPHLVLPHCLGSHWQVVYYIIAKVLWSQWPIHTCPHSIRLSRNATPSGVHDRSLLYRLANELDPRKCVPLIMDPGLRGQAQGILTRLANNHPLSSLIIRFYAFQNVG